MVTDADRVNTLQSQIQSPMITDKTTKNEGPSENEFHRKKISDKKI